MFNNTEVGNLIKFERLKQNIKQVNLAKGICSTSYLSKIEHNSVIASEEVIRLLLKRLKVNLDEYELSKKKEEDLIEELKQIYREITLNKDNEYEREKLNLLLSRTTYFTGNSFYFLILVIVKLQLALFQLDSAQKNIDYLNSKIELLSTTQKYLLLKSEGIFFLR